MIDILKTIDTIVKIPPVILTKMIFQRFNQRMRGYWIQTFPTIFSDDDLLKALQVDTIDELLENIDNTSSSNFFFDPDSKIEIIETIKKEYPDTITKTIQDADEICNHVFDLLGSGKVRLGENIDWHLDFKSGHRWDPKTFYIGTKKHIRLDDPSDVKVPWELSRCQHFTVLGKAYWYTCNEKYTEEFIKEVEDWIEQNPLDLGVNWACTMDVAIRAVNWIWGYYFFCKSEKITPEFRLKLIKSLYLHGKHIMRNLEFGHIRGNHYLSNIVGLIYLGIFLPECKDTERWLHKGISALEEEMQFQVHPDGVDFEASISYHRLVTELFISAVLLCKKNNIEIPSMVMDRLELMIDFVMHYTKQDGQCPVIGDADDGRLYKLSDNPINDHRHLLSIGAVLFNRADFKSAYNKFNEEAFWLLGSDGLDVFKNLSSESMGIQSKAYPNSGYYIMRNNNSYMIIRCGDVGMKGYGSHGHCDCLSFELFANGRTVIVDPGTYAYTADPSARNLFRSTKYHNTIVVDGEEMNRFEDDNLFAMQSDTEPIVNKWITTDEYDLFDGEHHGYSRLKEPVIHRRQIYFNKCKKYWIIKDTLSGTGKHSFDLYFHLTPTKIIQNYSNIHAENNIIIQSIVSNGLKCELQNGSLSESYGKKIESPTIKYSKTAELPTEFITVISTQQNLNSEEINECLYKINA